MPRFPKRLSDHAGRVAWRTHIVVCCLVCCYFALDQARGFADDASPFETFIVSKPASEPSAGTDSPAAANASAAPTHPEKAPAQHITAGNVQVVMTLFPGGNSVSSTVDGNFAGHQIDSALQFQQGMHQNLLDLGYLQAAHGGAGVRIGEEDRSAFSSAQGIRFYAPTGTPGLATGLGLYHGMSGEGAWLPAFDAQWNRGKNTSITGLLAADSSWRLEQETQAGKMHLATFTESDRSARRREAGFASQVALAPTLSVYQTLTRSLDGHDQTSSYGGTKRMGSQLYTFDALTTRQQGFALQQSLAGLLLPMNRQWLNIRWQDSVLRETAGTESRSSETSLIATLLRSISPQTQLNLSASLFSQSTGGARQVAWSIGGNHVVNRSWRWQANLAKEVGRSTYVLRSTLEYRLSPQWQVRLLTGPSLSLSARGAMPNAVGLQIVRTFAVMSSQPTGSVEGIVLLDGQPCGMPVAVDLDGIDSARTDRAGRFHIRHVDPGSHSVQVDLQALPASFTPQEAALSVSVVAGKAARMDLHLATVGQIAGIIVVKPDELGQRDSTAGIGVTVMDTQGHATTTDAAGRFSFGNLPLGRHLFSLAKETLPPGYEVEEPQSVEVSITSDRKAPPIRFTVVPNRREIVFDHAAP